MSVFTFTYCPQWSYEFAQVIAGSEARARELLNDQFNNWNLESVFPAHNETERIVFHKDYDNESYEG